MITHGNKQISEIVYARKASEGGGAVRLANIIRGAQAVFGGLYPKVTLLYPPTKAAILGAFGQTDGKAVIKATNAYLNALAATDPTKAQALAVAINANQQSAIMCGFISQYGNAFGDLWYAHLDMNFTTPIYPANGVSNDDRMWLYRKGRPTTYYTISDILSHADYYWYLGGFGNHNAGLVGTDIRANGSPFTIVKFFVPTIMPTGYKYTRADGGAVHVNGVQITNAQRETNYDFSSIIELNKPNYVTVGCNGSNNWGTAMGFKFT